MTTGDMAKTKDIQRRIKSISSTKRITRAMEMVEAAKMRKAVEAVLASRTYANLSWETLMNLAAASEKQLSHPLLQARTTINRQALILITGNRGLCGGFNSAVISEARKISKGFEDTTDIILLGKKGESIASSLHVEAQFQKEEVELTVALIAPIAKMVIDGFRTGHYDRVLIAYTDYINAAKQVPRVKQILPLVTQAADGSLGILGSDDRAGLTQEYIIEKSKEHLHGGGFTHEYTFEPNAQIVLDEIIPRLVTVQVYQALLESNASEHSARMAAMHQATKAASDLVQELTLFYNKARQAAITAEIAEITAGVAALE
jgi:F-type H+-transporting ATPase subunit gamma